MAAIIGFSNNSTYTSKEANLVFKNMEDVYHFREDVVITALLDSQYVKVKKLQKNTNCQHINDNIAVVLDIRRGAI